MLRPLCLHVPVIVVAVALGSTACHHAPPPASSPAPAVSDDAGRLARARADSIAAVPRARAAALARAAASRRDSIARDAARADSLRRAAEANSAADASARAQLTAPIHFDYNLAQILPTERATLDRKVALLAANRSVRVRIDGNADERGSDQYNVALGMRRATEVRHYLTERGIDSTRIAVTSNGEERPVCTDHDESCWSRNRRDEFVIVAGGDRITVVR